MHLCVYLCVCVSLFMCEIVCVLHPGQICDCVYERICYCVFIQGVQSSGDFFFMCVSDYMLKCTCVCDFVCLCVSVLVSVCQEGV